MKLTANEANARIAERVMGWTVLEGAAIVERERGGRLGNKYPPEDSSRWHNRRMWTDASGQQMACEECGTLPNWCTDPAASKALRDKLAERFTSILLRKDYEFFRCCCGDNTFEWKHEAKSTSEFIAVVLCALASVGITDVEISNDAGL